MVRRWPHQQRALTQSGKNAAQGIKDQCIVSPCGGGKSLLIETIATQSAAAGKCVYIYTHRVLLTAQIIADFQRAGVDFGVIGAGFRELYRPQANIQICSLMTVHNRFGSYKWEARKPDVVIVDEAHQQVANTAQELFKRHSDAGAIRVGFTATPVGLGGMYDVLVDGGKYSEMVGCGAHIPVQCFGPDRPDTSQLKPMASGDFSEADDRRINRVPTIFGSVYKNWRDINPFEHPAVGFAPGCAESQWFVDEFKRKGVPCCHIDAKRVVLVERGVNGVLQTHEYSTTNEARQAVLDGSRSGAFKIVWNRFVMREAINVPEWYHAIAATSMGGLSSYLQSIGRVLRNHPSMTHCCFQDHSGNLDRHGFPNEDREWSLGDTNATMLKKRKEKISKTKGDDAEPICCPRCCAYRATGDQCQACGYVHKRSVRMVRQIDGTLERKVGRSIKYKRPKGFDEHMSAALFRGAQAGLTLGSAYHIAKEAARKQGITNFDTKYNLPDWGDPKWKMKVEEYYPGMKK